MDPFDSTRSTDTESGGSPASVLETHRVMDRPTHPTYTTGMSLGRYTLTEMVGRGASGIVYRAIHQTLNIPVAIKVLKPEEYEADPQIYELLRTEARLLAQLNHPNIVRVFDFEDARGMPYLVMELVEGRSLAELIAESKRLPVRQTLAIARQVADGLAAAWRAGVIHRDVKPGNILLDSHGNAKLADLGQAHVTCAAMAVRVARNDKGEGGGTPAYMAPEQFENAAKVDFRADIYALGGTLYHALTGQMPFAGRSAREVMFKHITQRPVPPHELCPDVPAGVSALVMRMLAKSPAERAASPDEFVAAVHEAARRFGAGDPSHAGESGAMLDPQRVFREGVEAAKNGNRSRAVFLLQAVTELDPRHEDGWMWLASSANTPEAAISALEKVLALNPNNAHARSRLRTSRLQAAHAAVKFGRKGLARKHLRAILTADIECEQAWLGMAAAAETLEDAADAYREVVRINPNNDKASKALAAGGAKAAEAAAWHCPLCRHGEPAPTDTCPACRAVLTLDVAAALGSSADPAVMARVVKARAADRNPDVPSLVNLALAHLNLHDPEAAFAALQTASRLAPSDNGLRTALGELRAVLGEPTSLPSLKKEVLILVVDDSSSNRKAAALALTKSGYRVIEASDGPEALALLQSSRPAVIVLDVAMPEMDGYQVCKVVKADPRTRNIPVIFLTQSDGLRERLRVRMAGGYSCLPKPCKAGEILEAVGKIVPAGG